MLGPQRAHAAELAVEALDAQLLEPGAEQLEHHAAEIAASWQDVFEQSPHRLGGGTRMSIEIEAAELHAARKVDLDHPIEVQAVEEAEGIDVQVPSVGVEVVQIEQQQAAGRRGERIEEGRLVVGLTGILEIGDVVFDQERGRDAALDVVDAPGDPFERCAIEAHRHGEVEIDLLRLAFGQVESQMVAVPRKAQPVEPVRHLFDMLTLETVGAADRQPDTVRDHRHDARKGADEGHLARNVAIARPMTMAEVGPQDVRHDFQEIEALAPGLDVVAQLYLVAEPDAERAQARKIPARRSGRPDGRRESPAHQPKRWEMSSMISLSSPERQGSQPPMPGPFGTFQTSRRILTISSNPTLPTATRSSRTATRWVTAFAMSLSLSVDLTARFAPSDGDTTIGLPWLTV